jgi:hypothetical protein
MATVVFEGECCVDCLHLIANGDIPTDWDDKQVSEWLARIEKDNPDNYYAVVACPENCDGGFSRSRCDHCGSTMSGERHQIAYLKD